MNCPALCLTCLRRPSQLLAYPLDEPALVGDGHVLRLPPSESSIIHQEERWFHYESFSIIRLKAKER